MMDLLGYPFIVHALLTGSIVAVLSAASGYFLVSRGLTFAGHALPNIGFAGAAGAVLLGVDPVYGLFAFSTAAAIGVGVIGSDARERDVAIGVLMTFALGVGLLFMALYAGYAQRVYAILFGSILGISARDVTVTAGSGLLILAALVFLYRPLLFSTFDPLAAEARGVPLKALSIVFMVIVAITVSLSIQMMGALLVFTLLVGPAATAIRLVKRPSTAILLSAGLGLAYVWLGIMCAALSGTLPVSFFIATLSFLVYLPVRLFSPLLREAR
jgi:zinc/manganese transport system permease protein